MFSRLRSLLFGAEGASLVEYGLLIALAALVVTTAIQLLGHDLGPLVKNIGSSISN